MSFVSFRFYIILPIIFGLYWLIPSRYESWRKALLLIVSYWFYLCWKPVYGLILLFVTFITFLGGYFCADNEDRRNKTILFISFLLLAIMPLVLFKYYNFINESVTEVLQKIGIGFKLSGLNWAIPIGISFYTFQAVGYLIDVNTGKIKAETNFMNYSLFVSFFPQVVSGPISKANELIPQIRNPKHFHTEDGLQGVRWLIWGLFVKLVIADRLGMCVDSIIGEYYRYSGVTCFTGAFFYSLQIYTDFMGYSYIAMGVAKLFGFNLINNFNQPYFAESITTFWHRWHISLSRWLKDYVYIPLGGSRCSKIRNYWNIFVTFLVSGIWHGANWTFVIWGCLHGVVQIIEKALGLQKYSGNIGVVRIFRILLTFVVVTFLWVIFRMPSINYTIEFLVHAFTTPGSFNIGAVGFTSLFILGLSLPILLFKDLRNEFFSNSFKFLESRWATISLAVILITMILSIGVLDSSTFIYASF